MPVEDIDLRVIISMLVGVVMTIKIINEDQKGLPYARTLLLDIWNMNENILFNRVILIQLSSIWSIVRTLNINLTITYSLIHVFTYLRTTL